MTFTPSHIERAVIYLRKLTESGRAVKIEPVVEAKSLNQLRYLWLVFTHAAFESGSDKNYLYHLFLKRFPTLHEGKNLKGETELVPVTMSQFSKEEMTVFIDNVTMTLRSEGFEVLDPEDKRILDLYNFYQSKGLI